jgi:hypothetical protein
MSVVLLLYLIDKLGSALEPQLGRYSDHRDEKMRCLTVSMPLTCGAFAPSAEYRLIQLPTIWRYCIRNSMYAINFFVACRHNIPCFSIEGSFMAPLYN